MTGIDLIAVGDVILDPDHHRRAFDHVRHVMRDGDITVVNCDQVYSDRGDSPSGFWPIHHEGAAPVLRRCSTAWPRPAWTSSASATTIPWTGVTRRCSTAWSDAGSGASPPSASAATSPRAREPAIVERDGTRFGFLAYCCVGPPGFDATADRPWPRTGPDPYPLRAVGPAAGDAPADPTPLPSGATCSNMVDDIARLRDRVDIVVPIYHWGVHYVPEADRGLPVRGRARGGGRGRRRGSRRARPPAEGRRGVPGQGDLSRHERLRLPRFAGRRRARSQGTRFRRARPGTGPVTGRCSRNGSARYRPRSPGRA